MGLCWGLCCKNNITLGLTSNNDALREVDEKAVGHGVVTQMPPDVEQGVQEAGAAVQQLVLQWTQLTPPPPAARP